MPETIFMVFVLPLFLFNDLDSQFGEEVIIYLKVEYAEQNPMIGDSIFLFPGKYLFLNNSKDGQVNWLGNMFQFIRITQAVRIAVLFCYSKSQEKRYVRKK